MLQATMTPDTLLQGGPYDIKKKTLITGQSLSRGAVVGLITKGAATAVAAEENTGDGVMGAVTLGKEAIVGAYVLTCVSEATNAGVFKVIDPNGNRLDDMTVGVAYSNNHLKFTLADGAEDFDAGDIFTITVAAGSGKATLLDKSAVDGSNKFYGILIQAVDATDADVEEVAFYTKGKFDQGSLSFADGTAYTDVEDDMRDKGVTLCDPATQG